MKNRLSLKTRHGYFSLPEDASISIDDVNPLFNDYSSFSYDFELPLLSNRHILKDLGTEKTDRRLMDFDGEEVVIEVDGIPFRSGKLVSSDAQTVEDSVSVCINSISKPVDDLVADLTCRDIPVKDRIQIGEMIGDVCVEGNYEWKVWLKLKSMVPWYGDTTVTSTVQNGSFSKVFNPYALGFSAPKVYAETTPGALGGLEAQTDAAGAPVVEQDFINVSAAYPDKPYCNARVCYTHYKKQTSDSDSEEVSTTEPGDPYYTLDADRPQSGICFYVLYFLDCLFHHLGFHYDNSALLTVGDMKRLAFFTTHCKYDLERKYSSRDHDLRSLDEINAWLSSRGIKGKVAYTPKGDTAVDSISNDYTTYKVNDQIAFGLNLFQIQGITIKRSQSDVTTTASILRMYANSDNFPDMKVKSVLDSLWGSFGIRFLVDDARHSVRPVFIRDVLRDTSAPVVLDAQVVSIRDRSERVTGFRMRYSAESDSDEQQDNVRGGVTDYDTDYDYIDYSQVDDTLSYDRILCRNGIADTTCYIDRATGNAYRIKISEEATGSSDAAPAIFEVGAYKGVEIGDCSEANEDYVVEMSSDFEPMVFNDVNYANARKGGSFAFEGTWEFFLDGYAIALNGMNTAYRSQIPAAFVDETMKYQNTEFILSNAITEGLYEGSVDFHVSTDESYDPSDTDTGDSPLQEYDWGNAVAVMRGGGSGGSVEYYDTDYDGLGGTKWRHVAAQYAVTSDCIDNWGNDYDYNGTEEGIGQEERFSLKIRAYKEVDGEILCNDDERDAEGNITRKVRSRGLFDTFMAEYAHFVMNRRPKELTFRCNVSQLLEIQWDKRYRIGSYTFFFNKISYTVSVRDGLGLVTAEIFII